MKRFTSVVMLCLLAVFLCRPQSAIAGKDPSLDEIRAATCSALKGTGNLGVEFYFTFVPCYEESGNNKLMIYIASSSNGYATVSVDGKGFSKTVKVIANDIVPVELGPGFGQAFSKSTNGSIPPEQVYPQAAIHVKATVPIVVYGVTRFNYTSDSFMALPVQSLGKEYVVASMADMTWMYGGYSLPSETSIVAAYDNTRVDFTLGGPSVTVSGGGMKPGQTKSFTMNKGDVWVIGNDANSKEGDVSGSYIKSTKPVGVISGNQCANVPTTLRWCDFISEMELPTNLWGKFLQVPKYASRVNGYFMKVFAKEPNTKVFYNGSYWKTIQTVGGQEGRGWIYQRVDGSGNNVVSLSSDKPISATVFNTGQEDDGISTDPFQMDVMPIEQYQKNIMFCTPGSKGGIGFSRNFLGVIFQIDPVTGGMPTDLEFGTSVNGKISWRKLSAVFGPAFSTKDVFAQQVNGIKYAFKECVLPGDNVYAMRCTKPFMCYSYGGSDYDSYGHPTSGALAVVSPDTVAPVLTYTPDCDGSVGIKTAATVLDMPNDDSVRSNLSTIVMDPDSSFNYTLDFDAFVAGNSRGTNWRLTVDNPDVDAHALIIFTDRAGNQSCAEVNYTAIKLTINPTVVDFGLMKKGQVATRDITVKNEGTSKTTVTRLQFKAGGAGVFKFVPDLNLPFDLDAGASKQFTVQYTASNDGDIEDSIGVGSDCVFRYRTLVKGKTGEPIIRVSDVDFGQVVVGTTANKTFTVSSEGSVKLTVSANTPVTPDDGVYKSSDLSSAAISKANPIVLDVLNSGKETSKNFTIDFTPNKVGPFNATITFSSDATTIDSICVIKGEGIEPGLQVNTVDFGRCRINGNKGYTGPYTKDVGQAGIKAIVQLKNTGNAPLKIIKASVTGGDASVFGLPDLNQFTGLTLAPNEVVEKDITYIPASPKNDNVQITFENDSKNSGVFNAKGIGVVPHTTIEDVDFGTVSLLGGTPPTPKWHIKNLTSPDWEFYDVVKVTDIAEIADGTGYQAVGTGGPTDIGFQRMSYDKASLALPITLQPGETSPAYTAWYQPKDVGNNQAQLQTVSDAETEPISHWKGAATGGQLQVKIDVPDASICVGSTIDIPVTITNTSTVTLDVADVVFRWVGTTPPDVTLPAKPSLPIPPGATVTTHVTFAPKSPSGATKYTLAVDATPGPVSAQDDFTVTGEFYPSTLTLPSGTTYGVSIDGSTNFFHIPATLGQDLNAGSVMAVKATISYDPRALNVKRTATGSTSALVTINNTDGAAKGWQVVSSVITPVAADKETIDIIISGTTPLNNGANKELFGRDFQMLTAPTTWLGEVMLRVHWFVLTTSPRLQQAQRTSCSRPQARTQFRLQVQRLSSELASSHQLQSKSSTQTAKLLAPSLTKT